MGVTDPSGRVNLGAVEENAVVQGAMLKEAQVQGAMEESAVVRKEVLLARQDEQYYSMMAELPGWDLEVLSDVQRPNDCRVSEA